MEEYLWRLFFIIRKKVTIKNFYENKNNNKVESILVNVNKCRWYIEYIYELYSDPAKK